MASDSCKIPGMARKREKKGRSPSYTIYARIDPEIGEALERFLDAQRLRPSVTSAVEAALKELLEREGFWPPKEE